MVKLGNACPYKMPYFLPHLYITINGGGLEDKKAKILTLQFLNEHIWWNGNYC
jgi:hypothetical protein